MTSQLILMALFVAAAALEATLLVASDILFGAGRTKTLEAEIRQVQEDLKEAAKRIKDRSSRLQEAHNEGQRLLASMNEIDKQTSQTQRVRPVLVHTAGQGGTGMRFRAPVSKQLPGEPDPKQKLIWDHDNYVEVWTDNADNARQVALRQFAPEAGYTVGEFAMIAPPLSPEVAAVPEQVAG
jgi:cellobiose-specific phosphotransferase system component IIA